MVMSSGAAVAHPPEGLRHAADQPVRPELLVQLQLPDGADPFNAANTHVTSSDIAFWDDLAYVGDYGGFRIFDISRTTPKLVKDVRCYGPQADPSVFDTDRDGDADTLVLSVDSVLAGPQCGAGPVSKNVPDGQGGLRYPDGAWEGLRVFDISDPARPAADRGRLSGLRLAHQHAAPRRRTAARCTCSTRAIRSARARPAARSARRPAARSTTASCRSSRSRSATRPAAREKAELPIVYPGDADGVYKPVTDHGLQPPTVLDNFLACHDLSSFPDKGIVGAACGEQAQVWKIDRWTGLPDTEDPLWAYDQPNVDFWHSATFSWDGKIANFIDESFGDGCPTTTIKTGGLPGGTREFRTGNMFFFNTKSGRLLSEYRNSRGTNDDLGAGKRLTYCSSHLGIPVPAKDRYLLVNAFYRNGSSVIDFTDPTDPKEVAFADLTGTNTWSAYTYPRRSGRQKTLPVYSNDGLSRNYGVGPEPDYREAAYGFMRFQARVRADLVGFDRLNPQLQEKVIRMKGDRHHWRWSKARTYAKGKAVAKGARNRSARPYTK